MSDIRDVSAAFPARGCGQLLHFEGYTATCGGEDAHGPVWCPPCFVLLQRANFPASQIPAPQNNVRPATLTTARRRIGQVMLVNFDSEEAMQAVFDRLNIAVDDRIILQVPSGFRGRGILWDF